MAGRVEVILAADLLFQLAHLGREELDRRPALGAYDVMMAAAIKLMLVAGHAVGERDHAGQPAFSQQFEGAIHGGKADLAVSLLDQAKKFVSGEVITGVEKRAQDGVALLRVFEADALEVAIENVL